MKADDSKTAAANTLDIFKAHSGKQFLAAFTINQDMAMGNRVSDWLISPMLSGDAQSVSFWYKTLNKSNGTPSFKVAYSTTDSLYTSFTHTVTDTVINMKTAEWQKMTVSLPAGARYFAIHHTTPININQVLMIDDITYERGNGTVTGYKIYRDGNYLTTVTSPAYTDNTGSAHVYNVTVVTGKANLNSQTLPLQLLASAVWKTKLQAQILPPITWQASRLTTTTRALLLERVRKSLESKRNKII